MCFELASLKICGQTLRWCCYVCPLIAPKFLFCVCYVLGMATSVRLRHKCSSPHDRKDNFWFGDAGVVYVIVFPLVNALFKRRVEVAMHRSCVLTFDVFVKVM